MLTTKPINSLIVNDGCNDCPLSKMNDASYPITYSCHIESGTIRYDETTHSIKTPVWCPLNTQTYLIVKC